VMALDTEHYERKSSGVGDSNADRHVATLRQVGHGGP
jgi:hypothetical protein